MMVLEIGILLLVAAAGTGVVLTRNPEAQIVGVSFFGLMLSLMFMIFQAPDVALSQIVIGAVGLPLMVLLALACLKRNKQ
jgi:energy-converting hydrogenase B subunit D